MLTIHSELGFDTVDIVVGPEKETFRVHKKLLCSRAPVFDKMFNGSFKEAETQQASLPEDDPEAFSIFLEWLYSGSILPPGKDDNSKLVLNDQIKLYCFAEKYCLAQLMDYTISASIAFLNERKGLPTCDHIEMAYNHTASGSPLRRFMVLSMQYVIVNMDGSKNWKTEDVAALMGRCTDLSFDFLTLMRNTNRKVYTSPTELGPCAFHAHGDKAPCSVKKS